MSSDMTVSLDEKSIRSLITGLIFASLLSKEKYSFKTDHKKILEKAKELTELVMKSTKKDFDSK